MNKVNFKPNWISNKLSMVAILGRRQSRVCKTEHIQWERYQTSNQSNREEIIAISSVSLRTRTNWTDITRLTAWKDYFEIVIWKLVEFRIAISVKAQIGEVETKSIDVNNHTYIKSWIQKLHTKSSATSLWRCKQGQCLCCCLFHRTPIWWNHSTPTLLKVANGNGRFYDPRLELATWHISANLLENVLAGYLIDRFDWDFKCITLGL